MGRDAGMVDGGVRGESIVAADDAMDIHIFHHLDPSDLCKRGGDE